MIYRAGELVLNDQTWGVIKGEREIRLTRREFRVLRHFMQNEDRTITKEELQTLLVKKPHSNTIASTICYLKKKLGSPDLIENIPFIGYRINLK